MFCHSQASTLCTKRHATVRIIDYHKRDTNESSENSERPILWHGTHFYNHLCLVKQSTLTISLRLSSSCALQSQLFQPNQANILSTSTKLVWLPALDARSRFPWILPRILLARTTFFGVAHGPNSRQGNQNQGCVEPGRRAQLLSNGT